jgi:protein O-GlcNAc transferase
MTRDEFMQQALEHQRAGRLSQAAALYRGILESSPNDADALHYLGLLLRQTGHMQEAVDAMRRSIELHPTAPHFYNNLGNTLQSCGDLPGAIDAYHRSLELRPDTALVHNNLGNVARQLGQVDLACSHLESALRLAPNSADVQSNLGLVYKDQGRLEDAMHAFERALAINPSFVAAHSNLVYTMIFHEGHRPEEILARHLEWNRRHAEPLAVHRRPHDNDATSDRRLRIGYVSPDLRENVLAHFMIPLFERHDHARFEVFCYSGVIRPDRHTQRIRACADAWRSTVGLADQVLADLIRQDRIDLLVDTTMHMSASRLTMFAHKPAPVQVSWFAYPGTTGVSAIDYRITDPYLDPPGPGDTNYSERSLRLPDSFWCYDPLTTLPSVRPLPARANGYITYGCLNNFCKVNDQVLKLWGSVLRASDNARMILLSPEGKHRFALLEKLKIDPERIEFVAMRPRQAYLELYHRIDLCLDTFPYNGHTTSLDAYWMGVPVVTLVGPTVVGRAGWSQLNNLRLQEQLAAWSPEEFTRIALDLAADLPRLAHLRETLRERLQASPLMDADRFVRNVEGAYRDIWRQWCRSR